MDAQSRTGKAMTKRPSAKSLTRGNSTILIGANLLNVVAQFNGPASLTSIAQAAKMSPSRTYRYLRGLCDSGLLEQNEPSGLYDLGPQILSLGLKAIGRLDPVRQAIAAMPELTNATGLVSVLNVWGSHGPTAIRCEHGNLAAPIRIREGITLSMLQTAAGKVFLAYLPESQTQPALARELAERTAAVEGAVKIGPAEIAEMKDEVRRAGVARSLGTQNPTYASLSAPVFDRDGHLQLAISLIGVKGTFDAAVRGDPASKLRAVAGELSQKLGATPAKPAG
ncbi:MAG: IclR family transcriptional regulator [Gemmatimonas sp.]